MRWKSKDCSRIFFEQLASHIEKYKIRYLPHTIYENKFPMN